MGEASAEAEVPLVEEEGGIQVLMLVLLVPAAAMGDIQRRRGARAGDGRAAARVRRAARVLGRVIRGHVHRQRANIVDMVHRGLKTFLHYSSRWKHRTSVSL